MPDQKEWEKLHAQMPDGGPVYTETNPLEMIMEPWNALSSMAFLIPACYWIWKCRHDPGRSSFLICCCMLLAIGGLGSTFYHAFRKFPLLLLMDVLPIIVLTLLVSIYFWLKILPNWWWLLPIIVPPVWFRYWILGKLPAHEGINIGYFISGLLIFVPLLFLLGRTKFFRWYDIVLAVICLSGALWFRKMDAYSPSLMEIGTHWLWHLWCAAGAYFLGSYIYHLERSSSVAEQR